MYAAKAGAKQAEMSIAKTFTMALYAGAYIAFGGFLGLAVVSNCPGGCDGVGKTWTGVLWLMLGVGGEWEGPTWAFKGFLGLAVVSNCPGVCFDCGCELALKWCVAATTALASQVARRCQPGFTLTWARHNLAYT